MNDHIADNVQRRTNYRLTRKQNNSGTRYGNDGNITEKPNSFATWEMSKKGLEERVMAKIHLDLFRATHLKVLNWETPNNNGIRTYWNKKNHFHPLHIGY